MADSMYYSSSFFLLIDTSYRAFLSDERLTIVEMPKRLPGRDRLWPRTRSIISWLQLERISISIADRRRRDICMLMCLNNSITTCLCKTGERYGMCLKTKQKIDKGNDKKLSNPKDKTSNMSDLLRAWRLCSIKGICDRESSEYTQCLQ